MRWSTAVVVSTFVVGCLWNCPTATSQTTGGSTSAIPAGTSGGMTVAPPGTYPPPGSGAHTLHFLSQSASSSAECFCNSCVGQFLKNALKPLCALLGGGIAGPPGGGLTPATAAAAGGAGSTAATIQADQAGAKARRAAVRYLGGVDCHYYPEAETALISALRTDRSECVRMEAALALEHGCCCTKKTIEALRISLTGAETDGNPGETSPRVRIAAYNALQNCCTRANNAPHIEELPRPEPAVTESKTDDAENDAIKLAPYYSEIEKRSMRELVRAAEMTLGQVRAVSGVQATTVAASAERSGDGSLLGLWSRAGRQANAHGTGDALAPIAQPTLAVDSRIAPSGAQPQSPSVIRAASRTATDTRLLPDVEWMRLPDPNSAETFIPSETIPDSSLPNGKAKLY